MTDKPTLEPCPFCGGWINRIESMARSFSPPRKYIELHHHHVPGCIFSRKVWCFQDNKDALAEFVTTWNTRPTQPAPASLIEEVDRMFSGHGAAIRKRTDKPIPGEPYVSMEVAKALTLAALQTPEARLHKAPKDCGHVLFDEGGIVDYPCPRCVDGKCPWWPPKVAAALSDTAPASQSAVEIIERLKKYRNDWRDRAADVTVIDDAIAALQPLEALRKRIDYLLSSEAPCCHNQGVALDSILSGAE